jgi:hypothetical protein
MSYDWVDKFYDWEDGKNIDIGKIRTPKLAKQSKQLGWIMYSSRAKKTKFRPLKNEDNIKYEFTQKKLVEIAISKTGEYITHEQQYITHEQFNKDMEKQREIELVETKQMETKQMENNNNLNYDISDVENGKSDKVGDLIVVSTGVDCNSDARVYMGIRFTEGSSNYVRIFAPMEDDNTLPSKLFNRRTLAKVKTNLCVDQLITIDKVSEFMEWNTLKCDRPLGLSNSDTWWKWKPDKVTYVLSKFNNRRIDLISLIPYDASDLMEKVRLKLSELNINFGAEQIGATAVSANESFTANQFLPTEAGKSQNVPHTVPSAIKTLIQTGLAMTAVIEHETGSIKSDIVRTNLEENNVDKILWSRCPLVSKFFKTELSLKPILHVWYIVMACIVSAAGLGTNSAPVVVAAMLISSMMEPIKGMATSLRCQRSGENACMTEVLRFFGHLFVLLFDVGICLGIGAITGTILGHQYEFEQRVGTDTFVTNYTLLERLTGENTWKRLICIENGLIANGTCEGSYTTIQNVPIDIAQAVQLSGEINGRGLEIGLLIAMIVASASALALVTADKADNKSALVGIGISASLLPPAVNAGLLWALHAQKYISNDINDYHLYRKGEFSLYLTFINIVIIIIVWTIGQILRPRINACLRKYGYNNTTYRPLDNNPLDLSYFPKTPKPNPFFINNPVVDQQVVDQQKLINNRGLYDEREPLLKFL